MIEVRLFATLRDGREKIYYLPPDDFNKALDILEYFQIPPADVSIYLINGMHSGLDDVVSDEDIIALFPPVGGG